MMAKLAAVISFWLLLAPMPWGIALNHETQECGGFWSGDEYGGYSLPEGWEAYYRNSQGIIETEIGSCSYPSTSGYESPNPARGQAAEACCKELGYTYVGTPVGTRRTSPLMGLGVVWFLAQVCAVCGLVLLVVGLIVVIVVSVVLIRKRRRRKQQEEAS